MRLLKIRKKLDKFDAKIIKILAKRMNLIPDVAEYKIKNNAARYQPEREKEIIDKKRKMAEELGLNPDLVEDIIKRVIQDAHRIEEKIIGK